MGVGAETPGAVRGRRPGGRPLLHPTVARPADRLRAEVGLQESEERFRKLVQPIPYGIEEIDTSGIITFANFAHEKQYECGEGELLGRSIFEFSTTDSERHELRNYLKMLVKEQPRPTPYIGKKETKKGRQIDVQVDWTYRRDDRGRVIGFISIITDITDRKRAEDALAYQAHLVEDVSDAIIASDERFVTTAWNRAAEEMYGWTADEVIGRPTAELLQPEFVDVEPDEVFRRLLEEGHFEGEVIHLAKTAPGFIRRRDPRL